MTSHADTREGGGYLHRARANLFLVILLGSLSSHAAVRHLSVTGVDSPDSGVWRTFTFAVPRLVPGDVLEVESGVYTRTDGGRLFVDCAASGNATPGTSTEPITIRSVPQRAARLEGDGLFDTLGVTRCQHWIIDGFTVRTADNAGSTTAGEGVSLYYSSEVTLRNLLIVGTNRYASVSAMQIYQSNFITVEDTEIYDFIGTGINAYCTDCVLRRNYVNSRGRRDLPSGNSTQDSTRGDNGIVLVGARLLAENNISEGNAGGLILYSYGNSNDGRMIANISLTDGHAVVVSTSLDAPSANRPLLSNHVSVDPRLLGAFLRTAVDARTEHCSFIGGLQGGLRADIQSLSDGGTVFSSGVVVDSLSAFHDAGYGFSLSITQGTGLNLVAYGVTTPTAGSGSFTGVQNLDPQLGGCRVFIPESSPLKGAGIDGGDIGANILMRTIDGVTTKQPLWDPSTGAFPCGATVAGINDIPDASCMDVHARLHVGTPDCPLPRNYAGSDAGSDAGLTGRRAPISLKVGCGCNSGGPLSLLTLLMALFARLTRSSHRQVWRPWCARRRVDTSDRDDLATSKNQRPLLKLR